MTDTVEAAVAALRAGDLIILPTETVYGLGADAANATAVAAIFEAIADGRKTPTNHDKAGKADACLAASIFHFGEFTIPGAKAFLRAKGIPVRL